MLPNILRKIEEKLNILNIIIDYIYSILYLRYSILL